MTFIIKSNTEKCKESKGTDKESDDNTELKKAKVKKITQAQLMFHNKHILS